MPPQKPTPLPAKEAALFKTLLSQYESKQLKKAIKTADQILKKVGDHGETISMKGLVLTYMGKREEGLELVKKGVRLDLSSHICWHVYGLVHKQDRNYEEALKCYTQALKFDPVNMNILRDAATLQAQLRVFDGLEQTRMTILKLRMALRQNWIALAVAYALNNNWVACQKLLDEFLIMAKEIPKHDPDYSELLLFYLAVLERNGAHEEALKQLIQHSESRTIVDRLKVMQIQTRLLRNLGKTEEAALQYKKLIERNPDNYESYRAYFECIGLSLDDLSGDSLDKATSELEEFASEFPRALVPQRILLTITTGDKFESLIKKYLHRGLKKNIPSLFVDLKPLYKDEAKRTTIQSIVEDYRAELESKKVSNAEDDESPTTYVWTLYYLGLHYSSLGDYQKAKDLLDTAISHTPTLPELYMAKARNLKRAGDLIGAAAAMDTAVELDGQDRFLNTKCATYHLRLGEVEEAQRLFGLFTKKDAVSPAKDLEDMQSYKFLLEDGEAHMRVNKLAMALKRFRSVDKIFMDMHEDQYDFHSYCIRKFTINIYLDTMRWDDELRWNPIYTRAAVNASKIYLRLHDTPGLAAEQTAPAPPSEETEKLSKKQQKKQKMKAAEEARKAEKHKEEEEVIVTKDDDPDGHKAISVEDPLEQAAKLLQPFATRRHNNLDIWLVSYDVAVRRKKYLQALRALDAARQLDPSNPQVHYRIIDIQTTVSSAELAESQETILLKEGVSKLVPGEQSTTVQNSQYLQDNSSNGAAVLAVARASRRLGASDSEVEETVLSLLQDNVQITPQLVVEALELLEELKSSRILEFIETFQTKLPLATVFLPKEQRMALKAQLKAAASEAAEPEDEKPANGDALLIEPSAEK